MSHGSEVSDGENCYHYLKSVSTFVGSSPLMLKNRSCQMLSSPAG